jgi:hypothetical protein
VRRWGREVEVGGGYLCNEAVSHARTEHVTTAVACSGGKYEIYIYIYIEREMRIKKAEREKSSSMKGGR